MVKNMIGNPSWFERRKYGGWGITPRTWQGYVYVAAILLPFIAFQAMPFWSIQTRLVVTVLWAIFLLVDVFDILIHLKKDEREYKIEAIAERNAAWAMAIITTIGLLYQLITSALNQTFSVSPILVAILFGGLIVKSISNIVLERKQM